MLIQTKPERIYIETAEFAQHLNFDFILENDSEEEVNITELHARFLDEKGELILWRYLNQNGMIPNLAMIGSPKWEKRQKKTLFNPFHTLNPCLDFRTIRYEFTFASGQGKEQKLEVTIHPVKYVTKTDLILPLKGKLCIFDGHDYLAHHRRVDLTHPLFEMLRVKGNPVRTALDFVCINEQGEMMPAGSKSEKDSYTWGATVYAPGEGVILWAQNDVQDHKMGEYFEFDTNPDVMKRANGNCVVIDHGNGEVSWLVHLQKGSVLVREGDVVRQGQELAKVGLSGDASDVHLHYTFTDRFSFDSSEGVPSTFRNFYKKYGNEAKLLERGTLETGEIIWSNFGY